VIDILIINYNSVSYLKALLLELTRKNPTVPTRRGQYTVTVVDNQSTDGSVELVETQFPSVRLIARESNDGYAAAVNDGIAATRNREILLLNSDVLITPDAIASLERIWERLDFPGILAPLHLEEDGFPQLTWGSYPTPQAEARRRRLDYALTNREPWAKQAVLAEACSTRPVDWVSGSCMFFARSTADSIGPWDANFFLFFEDIDWCLRAREKGFQIYHTSEARITHAHGASVDQDPDGAEIEYRFSQCYFTKKHLGVWNLFKLRLYLTGKQLLRWLAGRRSGFERGVSWLILRTAWKKPGV